jgi:mRNA-degrading endonuclease RelE of RelBE toxin-antitoxin system
VWARGKANQAIDFICHFQYNTWMKVWMTPGATGELDRLPGVVHRRVLHLLERLRQWPAVSGAKALTGDLAGYFRLRTGDYRLRFRVSGDWVIVERIGHRDRFYED